MLESTAQAYFGAACALENAARAHFGAACALKIAARARFGAACALKMQFEPSFEVAFTKNHVKTQHVGLKLLELTIPLLEIIQSKIDIGRKCSEVRSGCTYARESDAGNQHSKSHSSTKLL